MSDENTFHAVVKGVQVEVLGDTLVVNSTAGVTTTLVVHDVADFDPDGGFLRLAGSVMEYVSTDTDLNQITLAAASTVNAAPDDKVDVWDNENNQPAKLHKAVVDQIDGFDGTATVVVGQGVAHLLSQNMRDGTGESVTLKRDGTKVRLTEVHGRAFALAAMQYLQGGMTTRLSAADAGVDIQGVDSGAPGLYLYDTGGVLAMSITDDAAGGVVKFWTGDVTETGSGWINPAADVGGPYVEYASPQAGAGTRALLRLYPTGAGGETNVYSGDFFVRTGKLTVTGKSFLNDDTDVAGALDVQNGITAANIVTAGTVHGGGSVQTDTGFFDNTLLGSNTGANINASGHIVRTTSSRRYKSNIEPLKMVDARKVLDLEPVTFTLREEAGLENRRTYAGVIAEQAAEVGADLWVNYDAEGRPDGFRYDEVVAALIPIIRDQQNQIDDLTARLTALETKDA